MVSSATATVSVFIGRFHKMLSMLSATPMGAIETGTECTPSSTTLALKWNAFASEWGAYEVTGCTGVNPKLMLTAGTTYTFDQSDASNW